MSGLLYAEKLPVNDTISIRIPLVGDVLKDEETYFEVVSTIIATPYDMMVQLDDMGIDFTKITSFELFCLMLDRLKMIDTSLVLMGIDITKYQTAIDTNSDNMILVNTEDETVIDQATHALISAAVKKILLINKQDKKPANEEARKYMIEKARRKLKRRQAKKHDCSELEDLIIGLVNTREFKYNYETVKQISIFQFYSSLNQISHKIKFDNTMIGYYAGTVKFEDLSLADRTWLRS